VDDELIGGGGDDARRLVVRGEVVSQNEQGARGVISTIAEVPLAGYPYFY
jgi:hypothetical protein